MEKKKNIYLIPGQGADERLFKNLKFDTTLFNIYHVKWKIPNKGEDLKSYALRLSSQIDRSKEFYLIGVSLGGMVATEINEILNPKKVILISSAKCRSELPFQYRFQKAIPIYKIIPKKIIKKSTFIAQPLFEPDSKKEKETCIAMLKDKDPVFLKRTIEMIINWDRIDFDSNIVHIHGNNDHTIPIKNVNYNFLIEDGSHMMILTRTHEISEILLSLIQDTN
ncbi:MAG: alpha/beta hydrolase [Bacteroidota bacterium]